VPVLALAEIALSLSTTSNLFSPNFYRFFETEGITVLTTMISQYKISVKEEPQFSHETFEERKARIMACSLGLSLTYVTMHLILFCCDAQINTIVPFVFPWSSPAGNDFLNVHLKTYLTNSP